METLARRDLGTDTDGTDTDGESSDPPPRPLSANAGEPTSPAVVNDVATTAIAVRMMREVFMGLSL